jgi:hypothetical protein
MPMDASTDLVAYQEELSATEGIEALIYLFSDEDVSNTQ